MYSAIEGVAWVQIDTLQVVRRAQYLTLWSRLGSYDTADFDRLLFDNGSTSPDNGRRLFEYWTHAACIIPLAEYRYLMPMMRRHAGGGAGWRRTWTTDPENARLLETVIERIRVEGPSRPADFRTGRKRQGTWWNWDAAKIALEHLYNVGELAISNRVNFQRVYDIRDRVLPDWVDRTEPTEDEAYTRLLDLSLKALGHVYSRPGRGLLPHEDAPSPSRSSTRLSRTARSSRLRRRSRTAAFRSFSSTGTVCRCWSGRLTTI